MAEDICGQIAEDIPEQIIEDIPELRLEDIVGDYRIITERTQNHLYKLSKIKTCEIRVIYEGNTTTRPELIYSIECYKIWTALDIHEAKMKELANLVEAA